MASVLWCDGYEHQTTSANDFAAATSGGIFHTVTGAASISYVAGRTGGFAIQLAPSAVACGLDVRRPNTGAGSGGIYVASYYFRVLSGIPAAQYLLSDGGHGGSGMGLFIATDGKLLFQFGGAGTEKTANSVCDGNWHRVDYRQDTTANPWRCDLQVDGVAFTQLTTALAADTTSEWQIRIGQAGSANTITVQYDDYIAGGTSGDYPFGAHVVRSSVPVSDDTGTSVYGVNIMEQGTGTDLAAGNQGWQYLDDWPGTNANAENDADHVTQAAGTSANFVDVNMTETSDATIWGGVAIAGMKADATTACNGTTRVIYSDATTVDVYSGDPSEVDAHYRIVSLTPAKIDTETEFDGLKMRVGLSTDPAPDPEWVNLMIQYAVPAKDVVGTVLTITPSLPTGEVQQEAGGGQQVDGVVLTITPSLPTGALAHSLTGVVLTTTPSLPTGALAHSLTGVALTATPSLPTGALAHTLTGTVLTITPSLPTGSLDHRLTGTVLTVTPSLPAGALAHTINGVALTVTPSLPSGSVSVAGPTLTGVVLTITPSLPTGALAVSLTGTVLTVTPTLPTGAVVAPITVTGVVLVVTPSLPIGALQAGIDYHITEGTEPHGSHSEDHGRAAGVLGSDWGRGPGTLGSDWGRGAGSHTEDHGIGDGAHTEDHHRS